MSDLGNKEIMAHNIQYYMDKYGKSRNDMCEALGVKYTTFTDWVKGNSYPRIDKIELMANYFGIAKSDLVEERSKNSMLSSKDERDIKRDLENIMSKLQGGEDGPASFDGSEIPEADQELFAGQLELMLRRLKAINKEKYNPHKNKK